MKPLDYIKNKLELCNEINGQKIDYFKDIKGANTFIIIQSSIRKKELEALEIAVTCLEHIFWAAPEDCSEALVKIEEALR